VKRRKLKAYLSGGMEYARNEGADWRQEIERWLGTELGHSVFNPSVESAKFRAKRLNGENFRALKNGDIERYVGVVRLLIDKDLKEISRRSDYLICLWDQRARKGAGTVGELTMARSLRIPVFMVTRVRPQNIPGWILGCTSRRFRTFTELKKYLLKRYHESQD
jgi:hypothetical protein